MCVTRNALNSVTVYRTAMCILSACGKYQQRADTDVTATSYSDNTASLFTLVDSTVLINLGDPCKCAFREWYGWEVGGWGVEMVTDDSETFRMDNL